MSFRARHGSSIVYYTASAPAMIEIDGRLYPLAPTPPKGYGMARVRLDRGGRVTLRVVSGEVNLNRMDHE
jgi:hypothetical protein